MARPVSAITKFLFFFYLGCGYAIEKKWCHVCIIKKHTFMAGVNGCRHNYVSVNINVINVTNSVNFTSLLL